MNANLKARLAQTGRRQYEIAHALGLSENELSRIVRGRRHATPDERRRLSELLGVDEPDLFGMSNGAAESEVDPVCSLRVAG